MSKRCLCVCLSMSLITRLAYLLTCLLNSIILLHYSVSSLWKSVSAATAKLGRKLPILTLLS